MFWVRNKKIIIQYTLLSGGLLFLNLQVILAKEAGLCYAAMGLVTDYDSWREDTEGVGIFNLGYISKRHLN